MTTRSPPERWDALSWTIAAVVVALVLGAIAYGLWGAPW